MVDSQRDPVDAVMHQGWSQAGQGCEGRSVPNVEEGKLREQLDSEAILLKRSSTRGGQDEPEHPLRVATVALPSLLARRQETPSQKHLRDLVVAQTARARWNPRGVVLAFTVCFGSVVACYLVRWAAVLGWSCPCQTGHDRVPMGVLGGRSKLWLC